MVVVVVVVPPNESLLGNLLFAHSLTQWEYGEEEVESEHSFPPDSAPRAHFPQHNESWPAKRVSQLSLDQPASQPEA